MTPTPAPTRPGIPAGHQVFWLDRHTSPIHEYEVGTVRHIPGSPVIVLDTPAGPVVPNLDDIKVPLT